MTGRGGVGAGWGLVCGWWAATQLCSDWMSGSHFIVQTSNFFRNQCHGRGGHVEVTDGPSRTFPQMYTFFVPNIWGLAQTVLISEAKVVAAADAAADAAAETNLKHKVTPCKLKNIPIAHNSDLLLDHKNSLPVAISAFLGTCINKGNKYTYSQVRSLIGVWRVSLFQIFFPSKVRMFVSNHASGKRNNQNSSYWQGLTSVEVWVRNRSDMIKRQYTNIDGFIAWIT